MSVILCAPYRCWDCPGHEFALRHQGDGTIASTCVLCGQMEVPDDTTQPDNAGNTPDRPGERDTVPLLPGDW